MLNRVKVSQRGAAIEEGPREELVLSTGWVSFRGQNVYFRPDRGSGGFALYSDAAHAKRFGKPGEGQMQVELVMRMT